MKFPDPPIVCCISEGRANTANFRDVLATMLYQVRIAPRRGVNVFQIREKLLSARSLYEMTLSVVKAAGTDLCVVVNDRADVAVSAGAAGVHLPSRGLPVSELRRQVGRDLLIGVSTHSAEEAASARDGGADYVTFGPVFESPGKGNGVGLTALTAVCETAAPMPVLALGGIDGFRAGDAMRSGASGYASIRYLNDLLKARV